MASLVAEGKAEAGPGVVAPAIVRAHLHGVAGLTPGTRLMPDAPLGRIAARKLASDGAG